jgi:hypothetical protein
MLSALTAIHVVISLVGILTGLFVMYGLLASRPFHSLTKIFFWTTALTSLTGFFFPFEGFKPSYVVAVLSLIALGVAYMASTRGWLKSCAIGVTIALYFNVFVLIAQSFQKVPALHALAPTQSEPPFAIAQGALLVLFLILGWRVTATRPA